MTNAQMIHSHNNTTTICMYIAIELSNKSWQLMFSDGVKRRKISTPDRDFHRLETEIMKARRHYNLDDKVLIHSSYEAGQDGSWLHRYLKEKGINNMVVDSSIIDVNRRSRRAKTDGIDAAKLVAMLIRYHNGEQQLWSGLHVPSVEHEDEQRINREIERLKKERTSHSNRMRSLLILPGIDLKVEPGFFKQPCPC